MYRNVRRRKNRTPVSMNEGNEQKKREEGNEQIAAFFREYRTFRYLWRNIRRNFHREWLKAGKVITTNTG